MAYALHAGNTFLHNIGKQVFLATLSMLGVHSYVHPALVRMPMSANILPLKLTAQTGNSHKPLHAASLKVTTNVAVDTNKHGAKKMPF